jgi:hypothetical protein
VLLARLRAASLALFEEGLRCWPASLTEFASDFVLGWPWNLGLWRRGESQLSNKCFLVQFGAFFREEFVVFRYMDVMSLLH